MDGDGEDDPLQIKKMLKMANKNKNHVIVSCRIDRKENLFIKFAYKVHLLITATLTGHWISFGNFSCFYIKNLKKILSNTSIWHAYSASLIKNTNIKRTYATRSKRFYGKTKVNLFFLVGHSLRIIGVFYSRVFFSSLLYTILIYILLNKYNLIFYSLILMINTLILFLMVRSKKEFNNSYELINIL